MLSLNKIKNIKPSENPLIFLTKKLWQFSKDNRKNVIIYVILSIIANIIFATTPVLIGLILNSIQSNGINQENMFFIIGLLALLVFLEIFYWAFHFPSRVIERKNAYFARLNYRTYLLRNISYLPLSWHNENHSGDITDKILKSSNSLFNFASDSFTIIAPIVSLVFSIVMLWYFHAQALLIVLPVFIIAIIISVKFDKILVSQYDQINKNENRVSEKIVDLLNNISTVIILRIERLINKDIIQTILEARKVKHENIKVNETKWAIISVVGSVMVFLVLSSYIIFEFFSGTLLIGTVYILFEYSQKIRSVFYQFTLRYGTVSQQMASFKNIQPVIDVFESRKKTKRTKMDNWKILKLKNLSFNYHLKEKNINVHIDNVSLDINKGEKIVFVGESGSGKTTMLKLIRNLVTPKKGEIYLDDLKLKNYFKSISYKISLIPQEPEIFSNTVKYNITLGVKHKKSYIKKFTDIACFSQIIDKLPAGFDAIVGQKGGKLSGGEKQRLALSRGLIASVDKELILLDEPTSSVDQKTEKIIYKNIFEEFKNKTIISTVHNLKLINMFDKIVFFENGKIVCSGNFEEVIKNEKFSKFIEKEN